jgi:hypothetical protein
MPVFEVLEQQGLEVYLVNAQHTKNVPGVEQLLKKREDPSAQRPKFPRLLLHPYDRLMNKRQCSNDKSRYHS